MKHRNCVRWVTAGLVASAAICGLLLFWLLRPYDTVRVSPEVGLASPPVVTQGGTVTITRDSVCNDGVEVAVHRWADSLLPDGRVAASFDLGTIVFAAPSEPLCAEPSVTGVTLPNYVIGPDGGAGTFRLRFDLSYQANPVRIVTVSTVTSAFTVMPAKES
jgi:hypothetical protein